MTDADRLAAALADRYRLERELGAGGMATVYLAADLRHDRKVALKVLRPELAAVLGADRFVQEIKTTAALQHPHILPLFDSGSADRFLYYVMPYIQGETLRNKLDREKQLGVEEAVRITREVADALDYAHRHGVIHRDIKPENILLHDGRPMVADFGIALALSAAAGGRMTETGLSLGTPHYMSPEQATAEKEITARSDVYSLASVLYEMLAGQPPHLGGTAQQIIMKIVTETPTPVTQMRKSVPPNVAAALARALEKLPADRFVSAREFAAALTNPAFVFAGAIASQAAAGAMAEWKQRLALPLAVALAVVMAVAGWGWLRPPPQASTARYEVMLPESLRLSDPRWSRLAISPDGATLAFTGYGVGDSPQRTATMFRDTRIRIFLRRRSQLGADPVEGSEGGWDPFFSPDGSQIGFKKGEAYHGNLMRAAVGGGAPVLVTDSAVGTNGASWGSDGYIYYTAGVPGPLMRVRQTGGPAESIGRLDSPGGEYRHAWPDVLPNGRGLLLTVHREGPSTIAVLDLATGVHRTLVAGVRAIYSASGHILFVSAEGALMAAPFDQDKLTLTGDPVSLGDRLGVPYTRGAVDLTISRTGALWYSVGVANDRVNDVIWVARNGAITPIGSTWPGRLDGPRLSPDGRFLAITVAPTTAEDGKVWIKDLEQGPMSPLTVGREASRRGIWGRDGREVTYISGVPFGVLYRSPADGSSDPVLVLRDHESINEATFSPDGAWLIYRTGNLDGTRDLHARRAGSDTSVALLNSRFDENSPQLSANGRWLAYASNETGRSQVWVRPFPNVTDGRWQVSTDGGTEPVWAHSGRELFYRQVQGDTVVQMVLEVGGGDSFVPGQRRRLFALSGIGVNGVYPQYDVTPDDQRFIMIRISSLDASADRGIVVVENLFAELRAKAPR
jgi:serine/threonine-protein kinase